MFYWWRPRFRGGGGVSRAGAWYLTKIILMPMAAVCIALFCVDVFVYHRDFMPDFSGFRLTPMWIYLFCAPVAWWVIFRAVMRRKFSGQHDPGRERWHGHPGGRHRAPSRYMTFRN